MRVLPLALLLAFAPAIGAADDDDLAADFQRLQSRVMTAQSEIAARRAQLEMLTSRRKAAAGPFTENPDCRDLRRAYQGASPASAKLRQAESLLNDVVAQIVAANHLNVPSLCRAVVSPGRGFGAWAPDQTGVVGGDESGQGQIEVQNQAPKTVLVTAGALARLEDDSELAALVGHELSHLVLNFTRDTESAILAANGISKDWKASAYSKPADETLRRWVLGQKETGELDADRLGAVMLRRAGYDPEGMSRLLLLLGRIESSVGPIESATGNIKSPTLDHPPARTRADIFAKELPDIERIQPGARPLRRLDDIRRLLGQ